MIKFKHPKKTYYKCYVCLNDDISEHLSNSIYRKEYSNDIISFYKSYSERFFIYKLDAEKFINSRAFGDFLNDCNNIAKNVNYYQEKFKRLMDEAPECYEDVTLENVAAKLDDFNKNFI